MSILGANLSSIVLDGSLTTINLDGNLSSIQLNGGLSNILLDAYVGRGIKTLSDLNVGDSYGGGIIAYVGEEFSHGFISHPEWGYDASTIKWGCRGTSIGSDGMLLGDGNHNTEMIMDVLNGCDEIPNAASVSYNADTNGYNDWYLPSYNELLELNNNKDVLDNFALVTYWSSSESSSDNAYAHHFLFNVTNNAPKSTNFRVRPIRNF